MDVWGLSEDEIHKALISRKNLLDLDAYFGRRLRQELADLAEATPRRDRDGGVRKVFILPGIMGSKLAVREVDGDLDLIWIDPIDLAEGRVHELNYGRDPDTVVATGVLYSAYLRMKYRLRWEGFDVSFLPYDWRHGIHEIARRTIQHIRAADGPVALVCHSMGGLVARKIAAELEPAELPTVVTVGTPNFGSYSPVTVLRLTHDYVRLLARLEERGPKKIVKDDLSGFPGLLEMMPSPARRPDELYFRPDWWPDGGVVPADDVLSAAGGAQQSLPDTDRRFHQIVGIDQETIVGARIENGSLAFELSDDGDGTVPRDLAETDGVAARYYYPGGHAWLCNRVDIIHGAADIIRTGETARLSTERPAARPRRPVAESDLAALIGVSIPRSRKAAIETVEEAQLMAGFAAVGVPDFPDTDPFKPSPPKPDADGADDNGGRRSYSYIRSSTPRRRLNVDLYYGNILNAPTEAYVVGVFQGVPSLRGAAGAIDDVLDGALSDMFADGQITGRLGEVTFVPTPRYTLRTDHVIVVGLGPLGEAPRIESAIKLAGRNLMRALCVSKITSIATVLWGSGTGIDGRQSFGALFEGMFESLIRWDEGHNFHRVSVCEFKRETHLRLEEELSSIFSRFSVNDCEIVLNVEDLVPGPLDRARAVPQAAKQRTPDYLTVQGKLLEDGGDPRLQLEVAFARGSTDSHYAGGDTAALPTSVEIFPLGQLDDLVERLRNAGRSDLPELSDQIFSLVLGQQMHANLDLDPDGGLIIANNPWGSRVPWELLHARNRPIATNGGLHRRYLPATAAVSRSGLGARHDRQRDGRKRLLLVWNPTKDLKGAKKEGESVIAIVKDQLGHVRLVPEAGLYGDSATLQAVTRSLESSSEPIDVMHYAGHAFFEPDDRASSGLVLSGHESLTGPDIAALSRVPRIAFLNACESGRVRRSDPNNRDARKVRLSEFLDRSLGLAEAFLLGGVSHLVGTIWPVDDSDATTFAEIFYKMAASDSIGRSVTAARQELYNAGSTSWVNYMHYGDPGSQL